MHEPMMITSERLAVPCVFYHRLPSLLVDEIDIFTRELVLRGFVICLDTEGAHGDLRGEDDISPVHQEQRRLFDCPTG
jgi:hypothetical protein